MVRNLLFTIEYDGSDFYGWQRQPNVPTVQGILEEVLSKICRMPIAVNGTSRTDAGVHALGQRASFTGDFGIPTDRILFATNNMLPPSICVTAVEEMPPDFHARFAAKGKTYRYKIRNTSKRNVFDRNYVYYIPQPLNVAAMAKAAEQLVGTHDFKCFQASGGPEKTSTVRTITQLEVLQNGDEISIDVTGDGFLYNMVRIIVGTLVQVGLGKTKPTEIPRIIEGKDRAKAGHTAPPQGLYLVEVYYTELDKLSKHHSK